MKKAQVICLVEGTYQLLTLNVQDRKINSKKLFKDF